MEVNDVLLKDQLEECEWSFKLSLVYVNKLNYFHLNDFA